MTLGFPGCSSDDPQLQEQTLAVEAMVSAPAFTDGMETSAEGRTVTRSWTPPTTPTRYYLYDDLYTDGDKTFADYVNYESQNLSLNNKTIDAFFSINNEADPLHCRLKYLPAAETHKWRLVLPNQVKEVDVSSGDYYIYGFIPREAADNATLTPNPTYDKGAVLTIEGMQTVSTDVCVIIGAKNGPDADHDGGLTAGDFKFNLRAGYESLEPKVPYPNYMYLLFDHLCSALKIRMKVYPDYDDVRTIKLKELRLQTATDEGTTKKKMNVTVTLKGNANGSDPIESVVYTPIGTELCDGLVYQNEDGATLTINYSMFLCHFIPHGIKKLILTSTYDVYDKNPSAGHPEGNLIRASCKATNTIDITKKIDRLAAVQRGYIYTLDLIVRPTYLYMLSEPDLDNPTIEVE